MQTALDQHITIDPGVLGGKPCIAGRRIAVEHVVLWHLRENQSIEAIAQKYDLSPASIHAALTYYYDHRVEIDGKMAADDAMIDAARNETPSKLGSAGRG
jgi:uncharacterized protein (DUF433 family)